MAAPATVRESRARLTRDGGVASVVQATYAFKGNHVQSQRESGVAGVMVVALYVEGWQFILAGDRYSRRGEDV